MKTTNRKINPQSSSLQSSTDTAPTNVSLVERWSAVRQQIDEVVDKTDSNSDKARHVSLLAVSKTKPADMVAELWSAGQQDFGENYLQEAIDKIKALKTQSGLTSDAQPDHLTDKLADESIAPIVWHYIGHIQRNKTRDIAEHFDWVHTIERSIIAKRLNNQRPDDLPKLNVLIQVNIDNEESKSGCLPDELDALVNEIKSYQRLTLRGLMIIPAKMDGNESNENGCDNKTATVTTSPFVRTKQLFDAIGQNHPELEHWDTLSMGMSSDMQEAIEHGSTMVRVGTAIFGKRA